MSSAHRRSSAPIAHSAAGLFEATVLECEDPADHEESEDICFEFETLQTEPIDLDVHVTVDSRPIAELGLPGRVVFGRKE
jgi:hypothetical protein